MHFDTAASLIAICTIVLVLGLQMLFFWLRDRQAPWLAWYAGGFMVGSAAVLFYMSSATRHGFLALGVGNACRILAVALLWLGARAFAGRKPEPLVTVLAIALWLALCSVPQFLASAEWRVIVASAFISGFAALGALELMRLRGEPLPSLRPAMAAYWSFAFFTGMRIPLVEVAPFPIGALPTTSAAAAVYCLVVFVHATFISAVTLSITRERRELQQRRHAIRDPLTGLLNRRAFVDDIDRPERRRRNGADDYSVLVLDLDHFKSVNDRYGHEGGDQVLQNFARIAREATRSSDRLYRMGGEEFCFVLPHTAASEAYAIAERIRLLCEELLDGETAARATVSIGVASASGSAANLETLLAAADAAVYEAKARGRNQTAVATADGLAPKRTTAEPSTLV